MALRPSGERWAVPNDASGVTTLVDRVQTLHPTLMVLEATGGLERAVTSALATGRVGTVSPEGMACPPPRTVRTPFGVYGFPTLLAPLAGNNRLRTGLQVIQLSPYTTYTDIQVRESFILRCLFPACSTPPPLSRFPSHHWQG